MSICIFFSITFLFHLFLLFIYHLNSIDIFFFFEVQWSEVFCKIYLLPCFSFRHEAKKLIFGSQSHCVSILYIYFLKMTLSWWRMFLYYNIETRLFSMFRFLRFRLRSLGMRWTRISLFKCCFAFQKYHADFCEDSNWQDHHSWGRTIWYNWKCES